MPVSNRRQSREAALQSLYQMELSDCSMTESVAQLREREVLTGPALEFAASLIEGVYDHVGALDGSIGPVLHDWTIERLSTIDRNILRIAAFELFFRPEIPPAVTLNEAVVLAKKYGSAESGKFVNGVLGSLLVLSPKNEWDRATAPPEDQWELPGPDENCVVEESVVDEGSAEAMELQKASPWTIRTERPS